PEVFRPVCEEMGTRPHGRGGLSCLAVTCRAFTDAALDSLWRDQNSLLPLLGCLPCFWKEPHRIPV
ncbi:hypothetical protein C8R43DRAFT_855697, partial [Mycena crocata]